MKRGKTISSLAAAVGQAREKCGLMHLIVYFISNLSEFKSKYPKDRLQKFCKNKTNLVVMVRKDYVFPFSKLSIM